MNVFHAYGITARALCGVQAHKCARAFLYSLFCWRDTSAAAGIRGAALQHHAGTPAFSRFCCRAPLLPHAAANRPCVALLWPYACWNLTPPALTVPLRVAPPRRHLLLAAGAWARRRDGHPALLACSGAAIRRRCAYVGGLAYASRARSSGMRGRLPRFIMTSGIALTVFSPSLYSICICLACRSLHATAPSWHHVFFFARLMAAGHVRTAWHTLRDDNSSYPRMLAGLRRA